MVSWYIREILTANIYSS